MTVDKHIDTVVEHIGELRTAVRQLNARLDYIERVIHELSALSRTHTNEIS
jgi:hypothetical protein